MFEKRDREFEEALAGADKLERRLEQLRLSRRIAIILAAATACLFFVLVFMSIRMSTKSPTVLPVTPLTLFMAGQQALMASLAHGEIRTLLAFKKLQELSTLT
jgi:hypothetical protein